MSVIVTKPGDIDTLNVLVTGSRGRIGRYVVRDLVDAGHDVTHIDLESATDNTGRYLRVDLRDVGGLYQTLAMAKPQAVIHLGAWANPGLVADTQTYGDNVQGTFNLFQACADLGINRIISASSAQVYGLAQLPPLYLPLDEAHPLRPLNCYALSKMAGEAAADYFVANRQMTILSFRFMGVRTPAEIHQHIELADKNPGADKALLWTRTDARDAAAACRLAIEQKQIAPGAYNITGARVVLAEPTAELVKRYLDRQVDIRSPLAQHESPVSCARAAEAFGYRPRYTWSVTDPQPESVSR